MMEDYSEQPRQYIRVPIESIQACIDQVGVQTSEDVPSGLVEDVSFRIRQIMDSAGQFMHHSKRKCLTVDDMDKAMKYSRLEPLYGHHSDETSHQYGNIELDQLAMATSQLPEGHTLPNHTPLVTASWLAVEGEKLGDRDVMEDIVQLTHHKPPTESQQTYLSILLEAVVGDDEDQRRIALLAVQNNLAIANILADLIQHIEKTLMEWEKYSPIQLYRVLKLVHAISRNTGLFLDPYSSAIYPFLREILLSQSYVSSEGEVDHWRIRQLVALAMAQLLMRCTSLLDANYQELSSHLQQMFCHPQVSSLPVLYGGVLLTCHLGYTSISEVLLPYLEVVVSYLNSGTESGSQGISKLYETLLVAAGVLLTGDGKVPPMVPSAPVKLSAIAGPSHEITSTMASSSGGRRGGEGGVLFGNTGLALDSVEASGDASVLETAEMNESPPKHSSNFDTQLPLTLYNYLVELFGEGLLLSLLPHLKGQDSFRHKPPKALPEASQSPNTNSYINQSLDKYLSREGFRPIHVQLPQKPSQVKGHHHRGREIWSFTLPQSVLPVSTNPLEQEVRVSSGDTVSPSKSIRGMFASSSHLMKWRQRHILPPMDITSTWI